MLTIGDMAKKCGVKVPTIRFYERQGLLEAPPRSDSGYRLYSKDHVEHVLFIRRAQSFGFTLEEIRELFSMLEGSHTSAEVCQLARRKIRDMEQKIKDLRRLKSSLVKLTGSCSARGRAESCAILKKMRD